MPAPEPIVTHGDHSSIPDDFDGDLHAGFDRELDLAAERPFEPSPASGRSSTRLAAAIVASSLALAGVITLVRGDDREEAEPQASASPEPIVAENPVETAVEPMAEAVAEAVVQPAARGRAVKPSARRARAEDEPQRIARAMVPPPPPFRAPEPAAVEPTPKPGEPSASSAEPSSRVKAMTSAGARASGVTLPVPEEPEVMAPPSPPTTALPGIEDAEEPYDEDDDELEESFDEGASDVEDDAVSMSGHEPPLPGSGSPEPTESDDPAADA